MTDDNQNLTHNINAQCIYTCCSRKPVTKKNVILRNYISYKFIYKFFTEIWTQNFNDIFWLLYKTYQIYPMGPAFSILSYIWRAKVAGTKVTRERPERDGDNHRSTGTPAGPLNDPKITIKALMEFVYIIVTKLHCDFEIRGHYWCLTAQNTEQRTNMNILQPSQRCPISNSQVQSKIKSKTCAGMCYAYLAIKDAVKF